MSTTASASIDAAAFQCALPYRQNIADSAKKMAATQSKEGCEMARIPPYFLPKVRARFIGYRTPLPLAPPPAAELLRHSQYISPRLEAIVQEYSDAIQKLYRSAADDSSQRGLLQQKLHEARIAMVLARASLLRLQIEQKRAHHLALHDGLTALPNRKYLVERLDRAFADAPPPRQAFALLHMEFTARQTLCGDGNNRCSDALLKIVAARLNRSVRAEDLVCRLGGDDFACLAPGMANRAQIGQLVSALFDVVSAPLKIGNVEILLQLNVGIAVFPGDGVTADGLLESAVAAMRFAKQQGSRYAFFGRRCSVPEYGFAESTQRF
jgi:diguanylate cyclase